MYSYILMFIISGVDCVEQLAELTELESGVER